MGGTSLPAATEPDLYSRDALDRVPMLDIFYGNVEKSVKISLEF
jgi:hypothetical protein